MQASKLRIYIDIAKSLMKLSPQTFNQLTMFLEVKESAVFKQRLDFLVNERIIEKTSTSLGDTYALGKTGLWILMFFNELLPSEQNIT
jgi:hypothetical protein